MHLKTNWKAGAEWQMLCPDGKVADTGEILELDQPKRMVVRWRNEFNPELRAEGVAL